MATRRPPRYVPKDSSRRRLWIYLAVALFIIADIVLILWALGSTRTNADATEPQSVVAATESTVVEPTHTASPTPEPVATDTPITLVPPTRILAALDATTAWRATTGACPDAVAAPEVTTDAGATWKTTDATGPAKVTALQRIVVRNAKVASMVGFAQSDCAPQFVKTFIAGDNYASYPKELPSAWYVDPANRASIHSPEGDHIAPCDSVVTLAPRDDNAAAVLCSNGDAFTTMNAAATWSSAVKVAGAVTLTASQTGYSAASVGQAGCAGVDIYSLTTELVSTTSACFPVVEPVEALLARSVAISAAGGTIWLWVGDAVVRSSDDGASWQ
jgi:hypothetical protein